MKWFLVAQFILFSLFTITSIEETSHSQSAIYVDQVEAITQVHSDRDGLKTKAPLIEYLAQGFAEPLLFVKFNQYYLSNIVTFKSYFSPSILPRSPPKLIS
ncbi:hypothetical protein BIY24_08125 [Halobacteriovorax marinus]|uniref:Uncharacterized protein n=1 Tax=Halobacteriovorax marinus (strain ATCC BAA-682 / DSM 15412 / SJ) TaxID=862908 RepID=E1X1G9_HALMS|nr:hypothetical protein [Halobacteriovorax marinus]ATH07917.1 hypothetical protein BIY24_08125 [Halobacteriovorax marinus]CBW26560.1 hypothetical protein BMS_1730 [Halobacteriovorax marinus SJ]